MKPAAALLLAASAAAAAGAARAEPLTYTLEPEHSWVQFELLHFGTSTIRGRLGPAEGSVTLDRAAGTGVVGISVPTATLSTGSAAFDARIRKPDLLATDEHGKAWFVARTLRYDGERPSELRGELTLRGVGKPLSLQVVHYRCYQHPVLEREVCGGDFEGRLRRSDFGIDFGLPFVADEVTLRVQVEAVRQ